MTKPTPLLPETTFQPLSAAKLESMINVALSHPQEQAAPAQGNVISFTNWRNRLAYGGSMAAMAASVMMAFMLTPQFTTTATASLDIENSDTADVGDLLLYESLEA